MELEEQLVGRRLENFGSRLASIPQDNMTVGTERAEETVGNLSYLRFQGAAYERRESEPK